MPNNKLILFFVSSCIGLINTRNAQVKYFKVMIKLRSANGPQKIKAMKNEFFELPPALACLSSLYN